MALGVPWNTQEIDPKADGEPMVVIWPTRSEEEDEDKKDSERAVPGKPQLKKEIAKFKADVKRVAVYCCEEAGEEKFKACRTPQNSLTGLAIGNKHACIQVMPHVEGEDAIAIAEATLKLKKCWKQTPNRCA